MMTQFRRFMHRNAGNFSTAYALGRVALYAGTGAVLGGVAGYFGGEIIQSMDQDSMNFGFEYAKEVGTAIKFAAPLGVGAGAKAISEAPQVRENAYHGIRRTF